MFLTGFVVAAAVGSAFGQGMASLSTNCQAAAASILTGPAAECLAVSQLVNVAMTPGNQSLITPVNNWLTSVCAQPACANATVEAVVSNITTGCSSDLNITSSSAESITWSIKEWYSVGREVACLQDTGNSNAYCVTTTLRTLENWLGTPLTLANLPALSRKLDRNSGPPKEAVCTDCVHAAYNLIRPHLERSPRNGFDQYLGGLCGSSFTDGSAPAAIKQTASTAGAGSSGAMSRSLGGGSAVILLVAAAGLTLFMTSM